MTYDGRKVFAVYRAPRLVGLGRRTVSRKGDWVALNLGLTDSKRTKPTGVLVLKRAGRVPDEILANAIPVSRIFLDDTGDIGVPEEEAARVDP